MSEVRSTDPASRLLQRDPVHVWPDTTLRAIAELLCEEEIGVVMVNEHGRTVGVVSERDLVRAMAEGCDPDVDRAEDVMTFEIQVAESSTPVLDLASRMLDGEVRHLPVVEDGLAVGIVSMRDVFAVLAADRPTANA